MLVEARSMGWWCCFVEGGEMGCDEHEEDEDFL